MTKNLNPDFFVAGAGGGGEEGAGDWSQRGGGGEGGGAKQKCKITNKSRHKSHVHNI